MDERDPKDHQHRKTYEPPVMVEIGPLAEVTHGGAGAVQDIMLAGSQ